MAKFIAMPGLFLFVESLLLNFIRKGLQCVFVCVSGCVAVAISMVTILGFLVIQKVFLLKRKYLLNLRHQHLTMANDGF